MLAMAAIIPEIEELCHAPLLVDKVKKASYGLKKVSFVVHHTI